MGSELNQVSEIDRAGQAVALLGGATGQSYRSVSLTDSRFSVSPIEPYSTADIARAGTLPSGVSPDFFRAVNDTSDATGLKFVGKGVAGSAGLFDDIAAFSVPAAPVAADEDAELLSRFGEANETLEGEFAFVQANNALGAEPDLPTELSGSGAPAFSITDLIEQALATADAQQTDLPESFDGSRQGEVRKFLTETAQEVGRETREFLQENVAGEGRETAGSFLETVDIGPVQAVSAPLVEFDYYSKSAELINGLLDSVSLPIGSIALPRVGPLLDNPREELAAHLA